MLYIPTKAKSTPNALAMAHPMLGDFVVISLLQALKRHDLFSFKLCYLFSFKLCYRVAIKAYNCGQKNLS